MCSLSPTSARISSRLPGCCPLVVDTLSLSLFASLDEGELGGFVYIVCAAQKNNGINIHTVERRDREIEITI